MHTIKKVKPSIVGVGIFDPIGQPKNKLNGTGFLIGNGRYVVTNYHVVPDDALLEGNKSHVIFTGNGRKGNMYKAKVVAASKVHDLAILKHVGPNLPSLTIDKSKNVNEGMDVAFTGFPIGAVLGLYPVTHKGIISSINPVVIPADNTATLNPAMLKVLKDPYLIYQLDAVAYPGNSGSPVYKQQNGEVIGVINKVLIKDTKESAIENPSGITYAIPIKFLTELINNSKIDITH